MSKEVKVVNYDDGGKGFFEMLDGKYHGSWRIVYPNGSTKWERQIHKNRKHGYDRQWNDHGQILKEDYYWHGLRDGLSTEWYENGTVKEETEWDMNRLLWIKTFDLNGQLLEDKTYSSKLNYQDIENRDDITKDYKDLIKYERLDLQKTPNAEFVFKTLKRHSVLLEKNDLSDTDLSSASFIGRVTLCAPGETWPEHNGEYLSPVLQLRVKDLPTIPTILSDLSYIMVFIHPEGYDYDNDDSLCIRTYKEDNLVKLDNPNDLHHAEHKIEFKEKLDFPSCDDLPPGVSEFIEEEYTDKGAENPYACSMGTKVGGWPSWIQTSEKSSEWQFVIQIDEYGEEYWDWGDCPTIYIFRHISTGKFSVSMQMY